MQAGAVYTNEQRRRKSMELLRATVEELRPIYGNELSTTLLAAHTRQNIKTVRKYLPEIIAGLSSDK